MAVLLGGIFLTGCGLDPAGESETAALSEENAQDEAGASGQDAVGAAEADGQ